MRGEREWEGEREWGGEREGSGSVSVSVREVSRRGI